MGTATEMDTQRGVSLSCVDQDERVLTGLGTTLRRHGFRSMGAASYDEATEVLVGHVADVVVSEVNFEAGPRGFDLFLWMRSNPSYREIPFLFHAVHIDRDILIAGKRFGVDDFIVKPADGEVIAAAVAQNPIAPETRDCRMRRCFPYCISSVFFLC